MRELAVRGNFSVQNRHMFGRASRDPARRGGGRAALPAALFEGMIFLALKRPGFLLHAFRPAKFKNGLPFRAEDRPVRHLIQAHGGYYAPGADAWHFTIPFLS
ncbi:hypothetical protein AM571_CH00854 [Rhizobium etli 8C-3]|uniref:Uncharacterized protein n=1 Tax=Rhizobium etli 8C-3 TaxID=538025 RepID=A0A1L5P0P6_RHIET|nr:hypothetical protein AM571_CH00854 [Rhizobium etli 8C-3]